MTFRSNDPFLLCVKITVIDIVFRLHLDKTVYAQRQLPSDGPINILSVGRLTEMKGREYAIKAVAKIIGKF